MTRRGCCFGKKLSVSGLSFLFLLSAQTVSFALGEWHCAASKAQFTPRTEFGMIVFNNKLWVADGYGSQGIEVVSFFDSWNTTDGATWTQAVTKSPYPMHSRYGFVVYNDYLWIIAGHKGC